LNPAQLSLHVFHAGRDTTTDGNVGPVGNRPYKPSSGTVSHAGFAATADEKGHQR
jgi:hypothetical protein